MNSLPTIEAVREHEARGALWIIWFIARRWRGGDTLRPPPSLAVLKVVSLNGREPAVCIRNGLTFYQRLDECRWAVRATYEPCDASGNRLALLKVYRAAREVSEASEDELRLRVEELGFALAGFDSDGGDNG